MKRFIFSAIVIIMFSFSAEGGQDYPNGEIKKLVAEFESDFDTRYWLTVDQFLEKKDKEKWIIVDVREVKERAVSIIPGAITMRNLNPKEQAHVLCYCTIGYRSAKAVERLRKKGIDAYNLYGGILAWTAAGHFVVDQHGKESKRLHVYGRKWNVPPDGYEAIY